MTQTKFTPGPWDFEPSAGKETGWIGFPDGSGFYAAIREYDGHLTAAAPDMYYALSALLHRYVGLVHSGDAGFWNPEAEEEVINSRDALAKALGAPHPSGGDRHGE